MTRSRRAFLATTILGAAGGLAGGAAVPAGARTRVAGRLRTLRRPDLAQPGSNGIFGWRELSPGMHATSGMTTGGNSMVVSGREASILIDTKFPGMAPSLRDQASSLASAPLRHVVNTHHHADHSGGNLSFTPDVELIAYGPATERIVAQHDRYLQSLRGAARQMRTLGDAGMRALEHAEPLIEDADSLGPARWKPTRTLDSHHESIELGGITVELHHMGHHAHTDNDLVVHVPNRNVVHTGDLVFNGLHPFFDQSANVSCTGWIATLVKVLGLCDSQTVVVPGHGPVTDRRGIEAQLGYLSQLWEKVAHEVRAGTPRDEVAQRSWEFMEGLGFEQIRSRAIQATYDEAASLGR